MNRISSVLIQGSILGLVLTAQLWAETGHNAHGSVYNAQKEAPQVLQGKLIDLGCYVMDMVGSKHSKCGMQCAQKGLPVGLLEEKTGKVYTVVLPSPGIAPHLEQMVRITGKVYKNSLLAPEKMEVQEGNIWKPAELPVAM